MTPPQFAAPILAVVAPLLAAFVLPVLGRWKRAWVFPATLATLALACGAAVATARAVAAGGAVEYYLGGWEPPWGIAFRVDGLGALLLLLVTFLPLVICVYSKRSVLAELPDQETPFYSVFLLLVAGLAGIASTADLFNLYVFLEITSLASYALVSIGGGAAVVSAFRYVILGTIGAAFYLLSIGYFYSVTGSLNMADPRARAPRSLRIEHGAGRLRILRRRDGHQDGALPAARVAARRVRERAVRGQRARRRDHHEGRRLRRHPGDVLRLRTPLLHGADPGDGDPRLDGRRRHGDRLRPGGRANGRQADAGLLVGRPGRLHRARHRPSRTRPGSPAACCTW